MNNKIFYIFRHGETDLNREGRWQGAGYDPELNASGRAQARQLTEKLRPLGVQIIYSSPLRRALQTAEIVADELHIPVVLNKGLIEGSFGVNEGRFHKDIVQTEEYKSWRNLDAEYIHFRFEGGESKYEIMQRMVSALSEILNTPETVIGISSHNAAIRYLALHYGLQLPHIANGALIRLNYNDGEWSAEEMQ